MKTSASKIIPVLIGVVRRTDGKYLLTDRVECDKYDKGVVMGDDFWQFPGGGMEVGETAEEGVLRELEEETGLDVEIITLLPKIHTSIRPKWQGIVISYLCKPKDENQPIRLNHESSRYGWFLPEEIKNLNSFKETYPTILLAEQLSS